MTEMTGIDIPLLAGVVDITDYAEISEILKTKSFIQVASRVGHSHMVPNALSTLNGTPHLQRRRIESKLFSRSSIAHYKEKGLTPGVSDVLGDLESERDADGTVRTDLVPLTWRMAQSIPALLAGIDGVDEASASRRFIQYVQAIATALTVGWQNGDPDALLHEGKVAQANLKADFFDESVARRRAQVDEFRKGNLPKEKLPVDLITLLLLHWQDDWEEELLIHETMMFLVASITTTASSFPHFVVRLEQWLDKHPTKRNLVHDIDFLQGAVDESLRFFVASPARLREATERVVLHSSGREISAGEKVALWFVPANMQVSEFGEDAAEFDPLRDTGNRAAWGLAFGAGPHMCIGKPLITGVRVRLQGGEDDSAAYGTMASMAKALYDVGLELDHDRSPSMNESTFYNDYASLPVLLRSL